jgi:site-specific recombinase XerD
MGKSRMIAGEDWSRIQPVFFPQLHLLEDFELERFRNLSDGCVESLSRLDERCALLAKHVIDSHFSLSAKKCVNQGMNTLKSFLKDNDLPYSHAIALEWLETCKKGWTSRKFMEFRRAVMLINDMIGVSGNPEPKITYPIKVRNTPGYGESLLRCYEEERRLEGCTKSTSDMTWWSCVKLLDYMEANKLEWELLTPKVLKRFFVTSKHKTHKGRSACFSRIRGFLNFLARKGVVPENLSLAIPHATAPRVRVIKTLTDSQSDAIYRFRELASTPRELRASAMIMLGLTMGLRASDVANLKLSDISFGPVGKSEIRIIQQKTQTPLIQPLTVEAGNSLWRYIHEGRPAQTDSNHVFVRLEAPFCELTRAVPAKDLKCALAAMGEDAAGFHVLRKTYASRLLSSGSTADIVASGLGHANTKTVERYMSTDEVGMRSCAIGLDDIDYCGGLLP